LGGFGARWVSIARNAGCYNELRLLGHVWVILVAGERVVPG